MPKAVPLPAGGEVEYTYEIVPTHFAEDRWVQMAEVLPRLRANVHHAVVYIRPPESPWLRHAPVGTPFTASTLTAPDDRRGARWTDSDILLVYAPGSSPDQWPANMAKFIPAGSDLVLQMHYTTNGHPGSDRASIGLVFSRHAPSQRVLTLQLANDHAPVPIPPHADNYRVQVHGPDRVTIQFDHGGRHGAIIARKYWESGKPCPIAVVNGEDPTLFVAGFEYLPAGISEYDFAGAIKDAPIEIFPGPITCLPIPAYAEIILEGHLLPVSEISLPEGPFGEFTGYFAADRRPCPVMEVAAIHHRDDPILLGSPPMKPPRFHFGLPLRAAGIWSNLEAAGITDIVGVWQHVSQLMTVVALRQRYDGHAKRAALIAAANTYMGRLVVVVDDDVDPSNLADVMWAVTTRCEPSEQTDIVRNAWSSALDPRIPPKAKERGVTSHSKLIIEAVKPFAWIDKFPKLSALSHEDARAIEEKWGEALKGS